MILFEDSAQNDELGKRKREASEDVGVWGRGTLGD